MTSETKHNEDENKERGNWSNKMDFMLSVIGYAVGLGNVWRFPYRAYQSGGASFLIPYLIVLVAAGVPLFFLEMALGQFASLGPISVWKMIPFFKGIGWGMVLVNFFCCIYYNMIIAYTLRYFFASLTSELPWQRCRPEWAQYGCVDRAAPNATLMRNLTKEWCNEQKELNLTVGQDYIGNCTVKPMTPSEIYWEKEVLNMVPYIGHPDGGDVKWDLVLCLLLSWIIVYVCLIKGVKSAGKVVYVTAIFPYVVLVILLIWNARLEGAGDGIRFYVIPRWERLADASVWYGAGTQIFYSLGIAFGGLHTMSSYNKFHNNVYQDAVIIAIINCGTSIFAGFVIFSVMGFMALKTGLEVKDVVDGGPGLAFIAYPEGIALMPVPQLWAVLFFLMLFTLGIDSQFTMVEAIITAFVDEFKFLQVGYRKIIFFGCVACGMFLLGLPLCTRAGIFAFTIFDWYSAGLNVVIICLVEILSVSYIYGYNNVCEDISLMIGHRPNYYFIVCWLCFTPLMMAFLFVFSCIQNTTASYGNYTFPEWFDGMGWLMFTLTMLVILLVAAYETFKCISKGGHWSDLFRPTYDWGPALNQHRTGRYSPINRDAQEEIKNENRPDKFTPMPSFFRSGEYNLNNPEKPPIQSYDNPEFSPQSPSYQE